MANDRNDQLTNLREMIRHAFPAVPYDGRITEYDDQLDDPSLDDEKALYQFLKGKQWTSISPDFVHTQPDGYVLLSDGAFGPFLAAWLMESLENPKSNMVSEFLVYSFSPKTDMAPDTTGYILGKVQTLTSEQRRVLRAVLAELADRDLSEFQRKLALEAIALLEGVL